MTQSALPSGRPAANLSLPELRAAILLLKARIRDLQALQVGALVRSDPAVLALQSAIDGTLTRIFGVESAEYHRLREAKSLDTTRYFRSRGPEVTVRDIQQGVERGRQRAIALLSEEIKLMKEQIEGDKVESRAIHAYSNLELHPEIARAASRLFRDGHYANAIEDAVKALNDLVRLRSGKELDGDKLMTAVFSANKPILRFNDLRDQTDQDEQKGFMMLFCGAVAGLRNPRAHHLIKDEPERALEFIAFISLLAKLLDGTQRADRLQPSAPLTSS